MGTRVNNLSEKLLKAVLTLLLVFCVAGAGLFLFNTVKANNVANAESKASELIQEVEEQSSSTALLWENDVKEPSKVVNMATTATTTTYTISSAQNLAWLATQDASFEGAEINLVVDINLSGKLWTPIGFTTAFKGTFNGNGHRIYGITMDSSQVYEINGTSVKALFAQTNGAVITDLIITGTSGLDGSLIGIATDTHVSICYTDHSSLKANTLGSSTHNHIQKLNSDGTFVNVGEYTFTEKVDTSKGTVEQLYGVNQLTYFVYKIDKTNDNEKTPIKCDSIKYGETVTDVTIDAKSLYGESTERTISGIQVAELVHGGYETYGNTAQAYSILDSTQKRNPSLTLDFSNGAATKSTSKSHDGEISEGKYGITLSVKYAHQYAVIIYVEVDYKIVDQTVYIKSVNNESITAITNVLSCDSYEACGGLKDIKTPEGYYYWYDSGFQVTINGVNYSNNGTITFRLYSDITVTPTTPDKINKINGSTGKSYSYEDVTSDITIYLTNVFPTTILYTKCALVDNLVQIIKEENSSAGYIVTYSASDNATVAVALDKKGVGYVTPSLYTESPYGDTACTISEKSCVVPLTTSGGISGSDMEEDDVGTKFSVDSYADAITCKNYSIGWKLDDVNISLIRGEDNLNGKTGYEFDYFYINPYISTPNPQESNGESFEKLTTNLSIPTGVGDTSKTTSKIPYTFQLYVYETQSMVGNTAGDDNAETKTDTVYLQVLDSGNSKIVNTSIEKAQKHHI